MDRRLPNTAARDYSASSAESSLERYGETSRTFERAHDNQSGPVSERTDSRDTPEKPDTRTPATAAREYDPVTLSFLEDYGLASRAFERAHDNQSGPVSERTDSHDTPEKRDTRAPITAAREHDPVTQSFLEDHGLTSQAFNRANDNQPASQQERYDTPEMIKDHHPAPAPRPPRELADPIERAAFERKWAYEMILAEARAPEQDREPERSPDRGFGR